MGHSAAAAALALVLGVGLSAPWRGSGESRFIEELACEEAVARLDDCCPAFDPHDVSCKYEHFIGCTMDEDRLPDVNAEESDCIREMSCRELVDRGVCERVLDSDRTADYVVEVCP